MSETKTIKITCPECGSKLISRPDDYDFDSNFIDVSCADCGRSITKDDVIEQATASAKKQIDDMFRDSIKGFKFK